MKEREVAEARLARNKAARTTILTALEDPTKVVVMDGDKKATLAEVTAQEVIDQTAERKQGEAINTQRMVEQSYGDPVKASIMAPAKEQGGKDQDAEALAQNDGGQQSTGGDSASKLAAGEQTATKVASTDGAKATANAPTGGNGDATGPASGGAK